MCCWVYLWLNICDLGVCMLCICEVELICGSVDMWWCMYIWAYKWLGVWMIKVFGAGYKSYCMYVAGHLSG